MVVAEALFTVEDLWKMGAEGARCELVRGELIDMPPAGGVRGIIAMRIGSILDQFVHANNPGYALAAETGFILARQPDIMRAPDAAYVSWARVPDEIPERYWPTAPDLAVEAVSPHDHAEEIQRRVQDFLAGGTRLVWVIFPESRSATVYRPDGSARLVARSDALDGEDVLPGLVISLADLFPGGKPT